MNTLSPVLEIQGKKIGTEFPTFFIADIAANHDGDINRARELIISAAEAGANAAKFQHFTAETIVSDFGFQSMGNKLSHQSAWNKSVYNIYRDATVNLEWTETLKKACDEAGIIFFSSPYSLDIVDFLDQYMPAYKIGSGDITWIEIIEHIARKNKPYILATGASTIEDVNRAVSAGLAINPNICLLQCNTNYTASLENFQYIQLNVLKLYKQMFPGIVLGLSDHTPGHATVLGAVTLGARVIEKHFTDDITRTGPDHKFSMDEISWKDMVRRTRELEKALGTGEKRIEENELETVQLQRRAIRTTKHLPAGTILKEENLCVLRPCPADGIPPFEIKKLLGKTTSIDFMEGEHLRWINLK